MGMRLAAATIDCGVGDDGQQWPWQCWRPLWDIIRPPAPLVINTVAAREQQLNGACGTSGVKQSCSL